MPKGKIIWSILGAILLLGAMLLPSVDMIEFMRGESLNRVAPDLHDKLLMGAVLFRAGMGMIGLVALVAVYLPIWGQASSLLPDWVIRKEPSWVFGISSLLLIGVALRLYGLNLGLWFDEIAAYVNYVNLPVGVLLTTYDSENQHFLYTILAHLSVKIFGDGAWAVRLPAVAFGVGSLYAVYLLGRQLVREHEALLATAVLTFSYHHIWFSQNARGYTGVLFFSLIASWLFLLGIRTNEPGWWLKYALAVSLGIFTHITMVFVVVSHFAMYLVVLFFGKDRVIPRRWMGFWAGFAMSGLFTFQLHALVVPQVFQTIGQTTSVQTWNDPFWTLVELLRGLQIGIEGGIIVLAGGSIIFLIGIWKQFFDNPFLVGFLFLPSLLGTVVVLGMGHPLWPRFFFFAVGFAALVLVRSMMMFGEWVARIIRVLPIGSRALGTLFCLSLIGLSGISASGAYAPKQDYQSAITYIESNRRQGDAVVAVGLAEFPYKKFFRTDWRVANTLDELNTIRSRAQRTWLVFTMPLHLQAYHPDIMAATQSEFAKIVSFPGTLGEGTVFVYRSKPRTVSYQLTIQDPVVLASP